jgi:hypothetical protein
LNNQAFRDACHFAAKCGQSFGYGENGNHLLLTQLRQFKRNDPPFNLDYDLTSETPYAWWLTYDDESEEIPLVSLALKMFSITPSEAGCERNFSLLKWFYGDRRTRLNTNRIESMSMMRSFWMTNIKKELAFHGKEITNDDLRHCTQISTVINEFDDAVESLDASSELAFDTSTTLTIASIANLDHNIFNDDQISRRPNSKEHLIKPDNINYNVDSLVSHFLDEEDCSNNIVNTA